jgi:hypothetical protein
MMVEETSLSLEDTPVATARGTDFISLQGYFYRTAFEAAHPSLIHLASHEVSNDDNGEKVGGPGAGL